MRDDHIDGQNVVNVHVERISLIAIKRWNVGFGNDVQRCLECRVFAGGGGKVMGRRRRRKTEKGREIEGENRRQEKDKLWEEEEEEEEEC